MKKRNYSKPVLKSIKIDNQISMVMMSDTTTPETDPWNSRLEQSKMVDPYKVSKA
jgi:hypothetical protein